MILQVKKTMIYERCSVLDFFHRKLSYPAQDEYKKTKNLFLSLKFTHEDIIELKESAKLDSICYYQKGIQTLCEAILNIDKSLYSWATVKLYYSIFYFLRATTICYNYIIVRWVDLYYIQLLINNSPTNNLLSKIRNDHAFTCCFYDKIINSNDIFNTNLIEDKHPYKWIREQREYTNYKKKYFTDLSPWEYWINFNRISTQKLKEYINLFIEDAHSREFLYCFQPEYACLALPIARAIETRRLLNNYINCQDEILNNGKIFLAQIDNHNLLNPLLDILISH